MTGKQKKLVEIWLVIGLLIAVLVISQDADWNAQLALLPFTVYVVFNWSHIDEFQRRSLKPKEIIDRSNGIRWWVYVSSFLVMALALVLLLSGSNIFDYSGFGLILLLIALPMLPIIFASQTALYRELANDP